MSQKKVAVIFGVKNAAGLFCQFIPPLFRSGHVTESSSCRATWVALSMIKEMTEDIDKTCIRSQTTGINQKQKAITSYTAGPVPASCAPTRCSYISALHAGQTSLSRRPVSTHQRSKPIAARTNRRTNGIELEGVNGK
jgi:hypothetical protein